MGGKGEEEKRERWLVHVNIKVEAGPDLYHQSNDKILSHLQ